MLVIILLPMVMQCYEIFVLKIIYKCSLKMGRNLLNKEYIEAILKILSDYDTLIDIFIVNKDAMSSEEIISYLEKYE